MPRLTALFFSLLLVLTGCIGDPSPTETPTPSRSTPVSLSPEERAEKNLQKALERLATDHGIHYGGSLSIGDRPWDDLDLQVTRSGVAYGSMTYLDHTLRVLSIDSDTVFVRAGREYWESALPVAAGMADLEDRAAFYAKRWVQIHPEVVSYVGDTLRPAAIAEQFRSMVDEHGVQSVRSGDVRGEPADVMSVGASTFSVSKAEPRRLLAVDFPRIDLPDEIGGSGAAEDGTGEAGAAGAALGTGVGTQEGDGSGDAGDGADDALETDAMDPPDIDDLYEDVKKQATKKNLGKAVDGRVNFNLQGDIRLNCPPINSGACTVTASVSNTVSSSDGGTISGVVHAVLEATATGPLNTANCTDRKTMQPNGSTFMSCGVNLLLPPCNKRGGVCTWPVNGTAFIHATADVDIQHIGRLLADKQAQDTAKVKSKPAPRERVINDLKKWKPRYFRVGNDTFLLSKERMKHILERHHHRYWAGGKTTEQQSFFRRNTTIKDIEKLVEEAIRQNRDKLVGLGMGNSGKLFATIDGRRYQLVIDGGRVVQFTPVG